MSVHVGLVCTPLLLLHHEYIAMPMVIGPSKVEPHILVPSCWWNLPDLTRILDLPSKVTAISVQL
jgi:hypothetical protein